MFLEPDQPRIYKKVWGSEVWLVNNELYCAKRLYLKPGRSSSLHRHQIKDETFIVESGRCSMAVCGVAYVLMTGSRLRIRPGQVHRFWVDKSSLEPCVILEISTHHDEKDVERFEPSFVIEDRVVTDPEICMRGAE